MARYLGSLDFRFLLGDYTTVAKVLLDLKREVQNQRENQALFFDKISEKREIFLQSLK